MTVSATLYSKCSSSTQLLFLIGVTVSLPAMIDVGEGGSSVEVCATLYSNGSTEKDFIITLGTSDGTGNNPTHIEAKFSIHVSASGGNDYINVLSDETFTSGSINGDTRCVNITILEDYALEENETFLVTLNSSDSNVMMGTFVTTIDIIDNDS